MRGASIHIALLLPLVLVFGCDSRNDYVVRVSCVCPGRSAEMLDSELALPIQRKAMMAAGVEKTTSISAKGKTDIYVLIKNSSSPAPALDSIKRTVESSSSELPKDANIVGISLLKKDEAIPAPQPKLVDDIRVDIDRKKSSARGVSIQDIDSAIAALGIKDDAPASNERVQKVSAASVTAVDGSRVVLSDVAKVSIVKRMDVVVRTFP